MADSLYYDCVELDIPTDHHASDLYIPVTAQTQELVKKHGHRATMFTSQIDGKMWFDVPFAYLPFWQDKELAEGKNPTSGNESAKKAATLAE